MQSYLERLPVAKLLRGVDPRVREDDGEGAGMTVVCEDDGPFRHSRLDRVSMSVEGSEPFRQLAHAGIHVGRRRQAWPPDLVGGDQAHPSRSQQRKT